MVITFDHHPDEVLTGLRAAAAVRPARAARAARGRRRRRRPSSSTSTSGCARRRTRRSSSDRRPRAGRRVPHDARRRVRLRARGHARGPRRARRAARVRRGRRPAVRAGRRRRPQLRGPRGDRARGTSTRATRLLGRPHAVSGQPRRRAGRGASSASTLPVALPPDGRLRGPRSRREGGRRRGPWSTVADGGAVVTCPPGPHGPRDDRVPGRALPGRTGYVSKSHKSANSDPRRGADPRRPRRVEAWARQFFTEVPGPIPFGGLDSDDPLAFKVYQPDRLVLGRRMEDHLRIGVCLWHSFAWPGIDMFGVGTLDRPWLDAGLDPMDAARAEDGRRLRVPREARRPVLLLPRRRRRPAGRQLRRVPRQPRRPCRRRAGLPGADRRHAPVGHGQPVHAPALPGRRVDQPRSRGVRLRGRAGQAHARGHASASAARTTSCGAAARATTRCSTRTSGARAPSWRASCSSSSSTSTGSASRARS